MEWINMKDTLPQFFEDIGYSQDVLTFCISHGKSNEFGYPNTYGEEETYLSIDRLCRWNDTGIISFRTDRFYGNVLYWMPLPEPPKE